MLTATSGHARHFRMFLVIHNTRYTHAQVVNPRLISHAYLLRVQSKNITLTLTLTY